MISLKIDTGNGYKMVWKITTKRKAQQYLFINHKNVRDFKMQLFANVAMQLQTKLNQRVLIPAFY